LLSTRQPSIRKSWHQNSPTGDRRSVDIVRLLIERHEVISLQVYISVVNAISSDFLAKSLGISKMSVGLCVIEACTILSQQPGIYHYLPSIADFSNTLSACPTLRRDINFVSELIIVQLFYFFYLALINALEEMFSNKI
jgi:hypothetical protein